MLIDPPTLSSEFTVTFSVNDTEPVNLESSLTVMLPNSASFVTAILSDEILPPESILPTTPMLSSTVTSPKTLTGPDVNSE